MHRRNIRRAVPLLKPFREGEEEGTQKGMEERNLDYYYFLANFILSPPPPPPMRSILPLHPELHTVFINPPVPSAETAVPLNMQLPQREPFTPRGLRWLPGL